MTRYDAIFIGAGNSNLVCALQLVKNGKKVLIVDKNNLPGGSATSFIRGRFEFNVDNQELIGFENMLNSANIQKLFEKLEILEKIHFIPVDDHYHIYNASNKEEYILPFGIENFINKMEEYVPNSKESLEQFFTLAKECQQALHAIEKNPQNIQYELLVNKYPHFVKIGNEIVEKVLDAIHMPKKAIELLTTQWFDLKSPINTLSFAHFASFFYSYITTIPKIPKKTNHEISVLLAEEILKYGGEIKYFSQVTSLLIEDGQAYGVTLENGDSYFADYIISGLSPGIVYGKLVKDVKINKDALKLTNSRVLNGRCFHIYLGLNQTAKDLGLEDYDYLLMNSLNSDKEYNNMSTLSHLNCRVKVINNVNPSCSLKGTCIMQFSTFFVGDCFDKAIDEKSYFIKKEQIAKQFIDHFEEVTGIMIHPYIEEIEIISPLTFASHNGYIDGCKDGYKLTGLDNILPRLLHSEEENYIDSFYFNCHLGSNLDGYSSTYLLGDQLASKLLKNMEGEEEYE